MHTKTGLVILMMTIRLLYAASYEHYDCSHLEYNRCVKVADPLVREPHLIFPDNVEDIDSVCRTWNKFVDCLKRFTDECFSDEQRSKFNKAVSNPIESVHKMCMNRNYQQEYLKFATCIKRTITDMQHCGSEYSALVDQVSEYGDFSVSKATICCSQDKFKKCVERQTKFVCDGGMDEGPALKFSTQIIDKALSFLQDQCFNYIPNSGECLSTSSETTFPESVRPTSILPSELFSWTMNSGNSISKQEYKGLNPPTSTPWIPSASSQITTDNSISDHTQILGSRTRPASYGRSNTWLETKTPYHLNVHHTGIKANDNPLSTSDPYERLNTIWRKRPDWITTQLSSTPITSYGVLSLENVENGVIVNHSTETWYPAAGNQLGNDVDEPNQQGLSFRKNNSFSNRRSSNILCTITVFSCITFTSKYF